MRANKILLLASSLATLALLLAAAYHENLQREWRRIQHEYARRLPPEAAGDFAVQLRQIVAPRLAVTDRCVACHVGMAPGEIGVKGHPVYGAHPEVVHDPAEYGCVVCHGGQGRATDKADAHGDVHFWPEPMLPREFSYAGCGSCHTHLAVPNEALMARGQALFERFDCLACHRLEGRGGTVRPGVAEMAEGPDLSRAGASGFDPDWYAKHLAHRAGEEGGLWRSAFGAIPAGDLEALHVFLSSRSGAPGLVESKALFHSLGCRGCHKIGGVGGDDGPDLTRVGQKDPGRLDFTNVPGERTLANWLAEHFRDPAHVVPGSAMPVLGLSERQIALLTFYMMSLRRSEYPEAYWPKDRIRAERFDEREFATDGATLYGTFCASCHGPAGEGMRYPGLSAFPAVGNPDFLAHATDEFIRETIRRGRPGRRMPAWGEKDGGLRDEEIDAIVAHMRSFGEGIPPPDSVRPPRWVTADAEAGRRLYAENCALCHGERGEGKEGTSLSNEVFLSTVTDDYLIATTRHGRRGTAMPAFWDPSPTHRVLSDSEIEEIVAFIRSWEPKP